MKTRLSGALWLSLYLLINVYSSAAYAVAVSGQGTWETTLQGRDLDGDTSTIEAYYDTALDITWLADANNGGPQMTWSEANAWATSLNINSVTDWRLPTVNRTGDSTLSVGGYAPTTTDGTDGGWRDEDGNPISELGNMFYVTLANIGKISPSTGDIQPGWGLSNTGPFLNLNEDFLYDAWFWSDEVDLLSAWVFIFEGGLDPTAGYQFIQGGKEEPYSAWAVHDGDVGATVPIPPAVWLFGSGLLGLIGIARRKKAA